MTALASLLLLVEQHEHHRVSEKKQGHKDLQMRFRAADVTGRLVRKGNWRKGKQCEEMLASKDLQGVLNKNDLYAIWP